MTVKKLIKSKILEKKIFTDSTYLVKRIYQKSLKKKLIKYILKLVKFYIKK